MENKGNLDGVLKDSYPKKGATEQMSGFKTAIKKVKKGKKDGRSC